MKILYFYQYFSTPKGSWGTRVYEFAKNWVAQGHDVTVVTSIYAKSDLQAQKLLETQDFEGIKVKVINVLIDNKQSIAQRIWSFIKYAILSSYYALTLPADVVIGSSGPITAAFPWLVAGYFRRRRLVFETRDLWPDGAIELGLIRNKLIQNLAHRFEKHCYKMSKRIVTLSTGMQADIKRRYGFTHTVAVPNSANLTLFGTPIEIKNLPHFFHTSSVAIYPGNIGKTNNSDLLFETAKILWERGITNITILLVGEGQQREELEHKAQHFGLQNFVIMRLIPKQQLVGLIQKSMVTLVPLQATPVLDTSSPNKLFESLAASVPVIQTTQGWIKDFLTAENCGVTVDARHPKQLADALVELHQSPEKVKKMGENARIVAEKEFDKNKLAQKMLDTLIEVYENE